MSVSSELAPEACGRWLSEVDRLLRRDWSLDAEGAGWSMEDVLSYWKTGLNPKEFVAWYAEKYDLIEFEWL